MTSTSRYHSSMYNYILSGPELQRLFKRKTTKLFFLLIGILATFHATTHGLLLFTPQQLPHDQTTDAFSNPGAPRTALNSPPQVGKVHACFGGCNPTYERALRTHEEHSERMGHPMFVLREKILSGLWSKPAYILSIILAELALPPEERLKWLLWNDADIVIMNPNIPLDVFIPPQPEFDYVNLLVTNDRNGLNNGVFLIRVNDWSVKLLSGIISYHFFRPQVELKYTEQSGMEEMIEDAYWRKSVVHVPQFWFNSYPVSAHREGKKDRRPYEYRPGALQLHFASNRDGKRPERMNSIMDRLEVDSSEFAMPLQDTWYESNITAFWNELAAKRAEKGITPPAEGAATNFFPVKNEDGSYGHVDALSEKDKSQEEIHAVTGANGKITSL
ncbi:hypothetical protein BP5796_10544 [Coleophoma crateriformis]|uniref:Glycosyltransferase family 34 protein n=1 Tax=Coleophoma crateriformis TaxID=565419 RepID=A0A3D8QQH0_9HELO|nr:hypothetical protein BP5796_10544 [Coleophoma crateriformis]